MVYQMWTPMVPAAEQEVQGALGVGAIEGEVEKGKVQPLEPVAPVEVVMIPGIGLVNIAPMLISGQPLFAKCASSVDKSLGMLCSAHLASN